MHVYVNLKNVIKCYETLKNYHISLKKKLNKKIALIVIMENKR